VNSPEPSSEHARWFADEVLPHEPALRGYLRGRFPSLRDIDDLVQESYARLLRARATGPIACGKAFVFVTARNLALNHLRHQAHERPEGLAEIPAASVLDDGTGTPETVARAEELQVLIEAIQSLPERCRQIVTLRKIYGLSQKEVAARLGIAEHTVEAQGGIGLRKCIEYFRARGHVPRPRP
jgi:RNA polymerase sigma factor (sigma-70 family)